jgi:predicted anti-sigma-YlaC factor YlaD
MSSMAGCRDIRQALGVYVLGAIDPAERAQVDAHLASCAECREELASLAGLPALLRKVPMSEAERLAVADQESDLTGVPSTALLDSLVTRTANVRRIRRWRGLAAAAAVVVVAMGGGAAAATALQQTAPLSSSTALHWHLVSRASATGARLTVMYRQVPWGTEMQAKVSGLRPGSVCEFLITDSRGRRSLVGTWRQTSWGGSAWYPASTWRNDKDVRTFSVAVNGAVVASVPAD